MRVKRGVPARARHNKVLKAAKGMRLFEHSSMHIATDVIVAVTYVVFGSLASTQLRAKTVQPTAS